MRPKYFMPGWVCLYQASLHLFLVLKQRCYFLPRLSTKTNVLFFRPNKHIILDGGKLPHTLFWLLTFMAMWKKECIAKMSFFCKIIDCYKRILVEFSLKDTHFTASIFSQLTSSGRHCNLQSRQKQETFIMRQSPSA